MQQHYRKVAFHVASALDCAQQGRCIALRTAIKCRGYLLSAGKEVCTMTADGFAGAVLKTFYCCLFRTVLGVNLLAHLKICP